MQQQPNNLRRNADLIVLLVIALLVAIYLYDAISASTHILNLIFVLPVAAVVLALCAVQMAISFKSDDEQTESQEPFASVLPAMALFAAYVLSLPWFGFDGGTSLFVGVFLWRQGERRWPWLLGYSVVFGFLLAIIFSRMLPYPMPMLLLNSAY